MLSIQAFRNSKFRQFRARWAQCHISLFSNHSFPTCTVVFVTSVSVTGSGTDCTLCALARPLPWTRNTYSTLLPVTSVTFAQLLAHLSPSRTVRNIFYIYLRPVSSLSITLLFSRLVLISIATSKFLVTSSSVEASPYQTECAILRNYYNSRLHVVLPLVKSVDCIFCTIDRSVSTLSIHLTALEVTTCTQQPLTTQQPVSTDQVTTHKHTAKMPCDHTYCPYAVESIASHMNKG